jgi:hypothetical protein
MKFLIDEMVFSAEIHCQQSDMLIVEIVFSADIHCQQSDVLMLTLVTSILFSTSSRPALENDTT